MKSVKYRLRQNINFTPKVSHLAYTTNMREYRDGCGNHQNQLLKNLRSAAWESTNEISQTSVSKRANRAYGLDIILQSSLNKTARLDK